MANNIVIAGLYKNYSVKILSLTLAQGAYLSVPFTDKIHLNPLNVKSITEVGRESANSLSKALGGTILFGTGGASLGAKGKSEIILEVVWKDGGKSLIQVDANTYKSILVGMYEEKTKEELDEIEEKNANSNAITYIIAIVITAIIFFPLFT